MHTIIQYIKTGLDLQLHAQLYLDNEYWLKLKYYVYDYSYVDKNKYYILLFKT